MGHLAAKGIGYISSAHFHGPLLVVSWRSLPPIFCPAEAEGMHKDLDSSAI